MSIPRPVPGNPVATYASITALCAAVDQLIAEIAEVATDGELATASATAHAETAFVRQLVDAVQQSLNNLAQTVTGLGQTKLDASSIVPVQNFLLGKVTDEANTRYTEDQTTRDTLTALAATLGARLDALNALVPQIALLGTGTNRPGDGTLAFTSAAAAGGEAAALPPLPASAQVLSDDGMAVQITGAGRFTRRAATAIEPGRLYSARVVVRRASDPSDPSGDAVRLTIIWLDQAKNPIPGSDGARVLWQQALRVVDGRKELTANFARSPVSGTVIAAPPLARYARLRVQTYGQDGVTRVSVIEITDVTASKIIEPISADALARLASLEADDLSPRISALEASAGTPLSQTFSSRSDAAAATVPATITLLRTLGRATRGDGKARDYRRVAVLAPGADGFTSQDGGVWQAVNPIPAMQAVMLNITRADIAGQFTGPMRFRTLDGAPWKLGTSAGPYAIQNLSGDWFEVDVAGAGGVLEPEWFGAVGDFDPTNMTGTDNAAAMARLFAAVPDRGAIALKSCLYAASAWPTTYNKGYAIIGHGRNMSGLVSLGGADGPSIQLASKNKAALLGLSMLTTGVDKGTGMTIAYNADIYHPFANRQDRRLLLNDFGTSGVDFTSQGWNTHGHLSNINGADYSQWWLIGRATGGTEGNDQADNTHTAFGLILDGTVYPTDHILSGLRAYSIDVPVWVKGACEGVIMDGFTVVNCGYLLQAEPDNGYGGRPQVSVINGHANTYKGGLKISAFQNTNFDGLILYRNPGSTSYWIGLEGINLIDSDITKLQCINQRTNADGAADTNSTGIVLGGPATNNVRVAQCHLGGTYPQNKLGAGIVVSQGTPGVSISPSNTYNAQVPISDNNVGTGIYTAFGARSVSLYRSANAIIPPLSNLSIAFDAVEEDSIGVLFTGGVYPGIVIPASFPSCFVDISAAAAWDAGTGLRTIELLRNGASLTRQAVSRALAPDGFAFPQQVSARRVRIQPGDRIELSVNQSSGGQLGLNGLGKTWLALEVVG